jgi:hypothetical protein
MPNIRPRSRTGSPCISQIKSSDHPRKRKCHLLSHFVHRQHAIASPVNPRISRLATHIHHLVLQEVMPRPVIILRVVKITKSIRKQPRPWIHTWQEAQHAMRYAGEMTDPYPRPWVSSSSAFWNKISDVAATQPTFRGNILSSIICLPALCS